MNTYLADVTIPGSDTPFVDPLSNKFPNIASVVNQAMPLVFAIAGIILLVYLVWGGFDYMTAMGDPEKAGAGRARITNAIVGFVIIFIAFWLTQILKYLFNIT